MIEQLNNSVRFFGFFTASKTGKTGLTVTVDVRNPAGTLVVTGGAASEVGGGFYSYTLASGSVNAEGEYTAVFKTADSTVDQQHIPSLWVVGRAGVENLDAVVSSRSTYNGSDTAGTTTLLSRITGAIPLAIDWTPTRAAKLDNVDVAVSTRSTYAGADTAGTTTLLSRITGAVPLASDYTAARAAKLDNLDALISSRMASFVYTAPDSAATIAAAVWGSVTRTLTASSDPTAAQIADAVWDEARVGHTTAGTFGFYLDAQVSGISGGTGGGTGASAAQIWDYLTANAATPGSFGKLIKDNLDATISSRNATAPDNAGIAAIKAKTDNLPADPASNTQVATRLATAGYTAPDNVSITAIKARTDNLPANPAAVGSAMTLEAGAITSATLGAGAVNTIQSGLMTAAGYTAPDNNGIAAIKAKTDALPASPASAQQITAAQTAVIAALPPAPDNAKIAAIHADYQQRTLPVALPDPAPEGYGMSGSLEVSALTEEQGDQLAFIAEKASLITSGKITVTTPVVEGGEGIVLIRGDDYRARDGRELDFTREVWADLTGASVVLRIGSLEITGAVLAARAIRFELTAAQTDSIAAGQHRHSIEATLSNGDVLTLLRGRTTVLNPS